MKIEERIKDSLDVFFAYSEEYEDAKGEAKPLFPGFNLNGIDKANLMKTYNIDMRTIDLLNASVASLLLDDRNPNNHMKLIEQAISVYCQLREKEPGIRNFYDNKLNDQEYEQANDLLNADLAYKFIGEYVYLNREYGKTKDLTIKGYAQERWVELRNFLDQPYKAKRDEIKWTR